MSFATQEAADFAGAIEKVGGRATRVASGFEMAEAIERIAREAGDTRELLYEPFAAGEDLGLPLALRARGVRLTDVSDAGRRGAELRVGLTGAELAVAETGSILVGGTPGAWGLVAVLPWVHVAVLREDRIRPRLREAFADFRVRFEAGEREWVWITGPSKTADIAKVLVTGIHGPNRLEVLVYPGDAGPSDGQSGVGRGAAP